MFIQSFRVESPNVKYSEESIDSIYDYQTTELVHENANGKYEWVVNPKAVRYEFKTERRVPKLGVMLVGWGGNNGSTLTAGVIANREGISWVTKDKVQQANYFGSLTQASTCRIGSFNGEEIHAPFKSLLPMVDPNDIVFGGWGQIEQHRYLWDEETRNLETTHAELEIRLELMASESGFC